MTENDEDKAPLQQIIITFPQKNGAECQIQAVNDVIAGQVFGAAWLLNTFAKEVRAEMVAAAKANQKHVVVPFPSGADRALGRQS